MKIGFIFECTDDGPDEKVYRTLVRRLIDAGEIGDIEIDSAALSNLPKVKDGCGKAAAAFFATGCQRVFVCWDLWPSHGENDPVCVQQRAEIETSLTAAGVDLAAVHFVCIQRELESWLIVDGAAVGALWNKNRGNVPSIPHVNKPDNHRDPKGHLNKLCQGALRHGKYQAHYDAEVIAKAIDLRRLAKSQSFCHFVCRLRRIAPGTKATICACPQMA